MSWKSALGRKDEHNDDVEDTPGDGGDRGRALPCAVG